MQRASIGQKHYACATRGKRAPYPSHAELAAISAGGSKAPIATPRSSLIFISSGLYNDYHKTTTARKDADASTRRMPKGKAMASTMKCTGNGRVSRQAAALAAFTWAS